MIEKWKLDRCRDLRREAEIAEERLRAIEPTVSARFDPTPRGTKAGRPTEDVAIDRISLEELMIKVIEEYRSLCDEIATACKEINPTLREVIIQRYVDGLGWEEIAVRLNYSESYIYELHRKALLLISP